MNNLLSFGIGGKKIIRQGLSCTGRVTKVTECQWLKVNTKSFRAHAWDGAVYPHMVFFEYTVDGHTYAGKRYFSWTLTPPAKGSTLQIYYDAHAPARFALLPK